MPSEEGMGFSLHREAEKQDPGVQDGSSGVREHAAATPSPTRAAVMHEF